MCARLTGSRRDCESKNAGLSSKSAMTSHLPESDAGKPGDEDRSLFPREGEASPPAYPAPDSALNPPSCSEMDQADPSFGLSPQNKTAGGVGDAVTIFGAGRWPIHGENAKAAAPDLQVPWGFREILIFLFFVALLVEVVAAGVSLILLSLGVTHQFLPRDPAETSIFLLVNQAVLFAGIMLYLYLRMHLRYKAPFWSTLQWNPLEPLRVPRWLAYLGCIGGGCTLALVIEAVSEHLGKGVNMPIETFFKTRDTALALMLMSVLLAPLLEETIFRGLLYPVLARAWGIVSGIIVTGILFGLMHSYQLGGSKAHVALLIFVGIVLTWVRAGTRSVLSSFLVHVSYNSFLTVGFIASGALRHLPPR